MTNINNQFINNEFINNIINHSPQNNSILNHTNDINQEIIEVIEQIYQQNILFNINIKNKQNTLCKLLNEYCLYTDNLVIGSYIRYIEKDNRIYPDLKLKMGGFVLSDTKDKILLKNNIGRIFNINKNKYSIFIKLNKNDKFRIMIDKI